MMQRIHLRCGSFGSMIRFWILVKKGNIRFRIKNPDSDFSKESPTYPCRLNFIIAVNNKQRLNNGFFFNLDCLVNFNKTENNVYLVMMTRKRPLNDNKQHG